MNSHFYDNWFRPITVNLVSAIISTFVLYVIVNFAYGEDIKAFVDSVVDPKQMFIVSGVVYDDLNDQPLSDVMVSVLGYSDFDRTDDLGNYKIQIELPRKKDSFIIYFSASNYKTFEDQIYLTKSDLANKSIVLNHYLEPTMID